MRRGRGGECRSSATQVSASSDTHASRAPNDSAGGEASNLRRPQNEPRCNPEAAPHEHGLFFSPARAAGKRQGLALITLCLAVLVAQIDMAVVNLGTRPIGEYFSASVIALQWVLDSYNLVYAVLLLTGGLLADLYGRRRIFMMGAAVFTGASLLCAMATSVWLLVAGRALAGLGAALLMPHRSRSSA